MLEERVGERPIIVPATITNSPSNTIQTTIYAVEIASGPMNEELSKVTLAPSGSPVSVTPLESSSKAGDRKEIVSEAEDLETAEDDPFMFRQMGRKFRARLKRFSETILFTRREEEDEHHPSSPTLATISEEIPNEKFKDAEILVWSAFRVPLYQLERDEEGRKGLPIILALIKVKIMEPPEELGKRYSPNVTHQINLDYGQRRWSVYRRVYDFFRLHTILMFRHLQGELKVTLPHFPSQLSYLMDASALKGMTREERREHRTRAARERKDALEAYLKGLLHAMNMQTHAAELFEFLECSMLSLGLLALEPKDDTLKEGYLKNRLFGTQRPPRWYSCLLCSITERKKYHTKWFIVRSSYIAFVERLDQETPSDVLLCDKTFHVIVENENAHAFLKPLTITIVNSAKKLEVRPESNSQMNYWLAAFRRLALECVWCQAHRFGSFAPLRKGCRMEWLIDAEQYYTELVRAIQSAQNEIYLHGWWISPELYLVRPAAAHPHMRLDRLLQRKAREGVKIYILVFKELSVALALNSAHTKISFEKLHPNIRVQRHPDHLGGILYWAHHEKLAIMDQKVAFTGGLDLCFGRYDAHSHRLTDNHQVDPAMQIWSGLDYSNPRIRDFRNVIQHTSALVDRTQIPRMPWHDVHGVVYGAPARDLARHFIERWNFVKQQKAMHKTEHIPFLSPRSEFTPSELESAGYLGTVRLQALRSVSEWSLGTVPETSIYDAYMHYIENSQHFIYIENQFFISRSADAQSTPIKNRIAQAIVERILRAAGEGKPFKVFVFLPLMPAFEAAVNRSEASSLRMIMQGQYSGISRGPHSILGQLSQRGIKPEEYITFYSLRKYEILNGKAVTEQLYIHSKVLIVDDQVALMGSANINDRSMLGVRDSEVAIVIEDDDQLPAILNGKHVTIARKVRELRVRLLQEHLGLLHVPWSDAKVQALFDPTTEDFCYNILRKQASLNTQIFRELFHCVPDDCVDSWEEYRRFTEQPRVHVFDTALGINSLEMLEAIQGSIVLFPTQFLCHEDLAASLLTPEFLLPIEVYL